MGLGTAVIALFMSGCGDAKMASRSMTPTIKQGEKVSINYGAYAMDGPRRWDVVAFEPPNPPGAIWIFRAVGMPGEAVSFEDGRITLDGKPLELPAHLSYITYVSVDHPAFNNVGSEIKLPYVIPQDHYFLLGDNSTNAYDSRFWGGVPRSNIVGRVTGK
jgi:signal peptidase I